MNVNPNTTVDHTDGVVQNFYIDAEGNRVEIPFDVNDGRTYDGSDGEAAQSETAFIAEDLPGHAVTVH